MSTTSSKAKARGSRSKASITKSDGISKLETLLALLRQATGASIQELAAATGWQTHSVRGALAGTLKKKGHLILSEVTDEVRRYRVTEVQA